MFHDGHRLVTAEDLTGRCARGCCGHHVDGKGRVWHRCSLWIGLCICGGA
jgi:hypothetical protein